MADSAPGRQMRPLTAPALERAITAIDLPVMVCSARSAIGRILWVNDAFIQVTGRPSSEVIGRSPRLLLGPRSNLFAVQGLLKQLRMGQGANATLLTYRADGTPFWSQFRVTPVTNESDRLEWWAVVIVDVTEIVDGAVEPLGVHEANLIDAPGSESDVVSFGNNGEQYGVPVDLGNGDDPEHRARGWRFPGEAASISRARHAVLRACRDWDIEVAPNAALVVSEMAANAVLHGWGEIGVRVLTGAEGLRIEVADSNPAPPVTSTTGAQTDGGFGLHIINHLAQWGWYPSGEGKIVWALLPTGLELDDPPDEVA